MTRTCAILIVAACASKVPPTRHYVLSPPTTEPASSNTGVTLSIEPLETDIAYDDERIVYRPTPYRLDYYNYHRWSSPPGALSAAFLEDSFEQSGRFHAVTREKRSSAVTLGGRILAIEEVDTSPTLWHGHLAIELTLIDTESGNVLWAEQFEEREPLPQQSPEGLARALSIAMQRISARALTSVAEHAAPTARAQKSGRSKPAEAARLEP